MRLTIIAGEHVSSLEISPDMKMKNFLALCKLELPSIANAPNEKLALTCSGRNFIANAWLANKRLQELNIRDEDAIHFEMISASSTSQTPYSEEERQRRGRLMDDQNSEEGQRYIADEIEQERIVRMQKVAMEHMPEAFIPLNLLYIRMMINNHPVIARIESAAQSSILSKSCAQRCGIHVQAIGIGGSQNMVGSILACEVQVHDRIFACPFEVMADRDIDIQFGLDLLLRHGCVIDLAKNVLRFGGGTETPFLSKQEVEREKQTIALVEVMETAERTMD